MFNRLKLAFRNWIFSAEDPNGSEVIRDSSARYGVSMTKSVGPSSSSRSLESGNPMRFSIYAAAGGQVVEYMKYDPKKGDHQTSLYVVTHEQDLPSELAKIITLEGMK